ncbi:hypothetical protein H2203_003070 [Taxawa tesnikishii (nom. ined.)]|nr:hypothetical protein H2203_003070 [Dothideales sp. JES 119]
MAFLPNPKTHSTHLRFPSALFPLLFPQSQEQPVPNITQPGLDHAPPIRLGINTSNPDVHALAPHLADLSQSVGAGQDATHDDALDAPVPERVDGGAAGGAGRDYGIEEEREVGGSVRGDEEELW